MKGIVILLSNQLTSMSENATAFLLFLTFARMIFMKNVLPVPLEVLIIANDSVQEIVHKGNT